MVAEAHNGLAAFIAVALTIAAVVALFAAPLMAAFVASLVAMRAALLGARRLRTRAGEPGDVARLGGSIGLRLTCGFRLTGIALAATGATAAVPPPSRDSVALADRPTATETLVLVERPPSLASRVWFPGDASTASGKGACPTLSPSTKISAPAVAET